VAIHTQVEATKPVTGKTVTTTLEHNSFRTIVSHDCFDDWLKDIAVGLVCDAVAQREIDRVVLAAANTNIAQFAGTGKVLAVLVEGNGHDSVGRVKGFLDTIAMVDVDVNVQDTLLVSQEFDDAENDVYRNKSTFAGEIGAY
jgi:hypothetical protein